MFGKEGPRTQPLGGCSDCWLRGAGPSPAQAAATPRRSASGRPGDARRVWRAVLPGSLLVPAPLPEQQAPRLAFAFRPLSCPPAAAEGKRRSSGALATQGHRRCPLVRGHLGCRKGLTCGRTAVMVIPAGPRPPASPGRFGQLCTAPSTAGKPFLPRPGWRLLWQ